MKYLWPVVFHISLHDCFSVSQQQRRNFSASYSRIRDSESVNEKKAILEKGLAGFSFYAGFSMCENIIYSYTALI